MPTKTSPEEIELSNFKDRKTQQLESDIKLRLELAHNIINTAEDKLKDISNNIDNFLIELSLKLDITVENLVFINASTLFLKVRGKSEISIFEQILKYNKYIYVPDYLSQPYVSRLNSDPVCSIRLINIQDEILKTNKNFKRLVSNINGFKRKYTHHFWP